MILLKTLCSVMIVAVLLSCQTSVREVELTEGEKVSLARLSQENVVYFGAPPMIPRDHDFVIGEDIRLSENGGQDCLDCHYDPDEEDAPQTSHPERHNCVQCHLPLLDETAWENDFRVENTFEKYQPAP